MRKVFLILLIFFTGFVNCQNKDFYSSYIINRTLNGYESEAKGVLYVSKDQSNFTLSVFEQPNNKSKEKQQEPVLIIDDKKSCTDDQQYFYDYVKKNSHFLLFEDDCNNKNFVEEAKIDPVWKTISNVEKIGKYTTQKAEAIINDRLWTVYYDPSIKVKANPWRFAGIDGLIVKAEDEKKEYTFVLSEFSGNILDKNLDEKYAYKKLSFNEYRQKTIKEYRKNMVEEIKKFSLNSEDEILKILEPYESLEFIEKK